MRSLFIVALICVSAANAQRLSIGVLAGVPFTDVVTDSKGVFLSTSTNVVVGPSLQVALTKNFRIEADALYRPYGFSSSLQHFSLNQWRFPLLLQYRFGSGAIKPFLEGGLAVNHLAISPGRPVSVIVISADQLKQFTGLLNSTHASTVLGAGVDINVPFIHRISAELRYTREGSPNFLDISNLNNAEVLVGFHF